MSPLAIPLIPLPLTLALLDTPGAWAQSIKERAKERQPGDVPPPLPGLLRLYGPNEDLHRYRAPLSRPWEGPASALTGMRAVPKVPAVVVVPTRYTFFRLGETVAFAASLLGIEAQPLPPFCVRPLAGLWDRFSAWLEEADRAASLSSVALRMEDPDLRPFLEAVQQAAVYARSEVELLHALSALVEYDLAGLPRDEIRDPLHRFTPRVMDTLRSTGLMSHLLPRARGEEDGDESGGPQSPLTLKAEAFLKQQEAPSAGSLPRGLSRVLPVGKGEFHRLEEVVAGLFRELGQEPIDLPGEPFSVRPLKGAQHRLAHRVAELNAVVIPHGIGLDLVSGEAFPLLQKFSDGIDGFDPPRERLLMRLLGICCEHAFVGPQTVHADVIASCQHRCTFCYTYTPLIGRKNLKEMDRGNGSRLDFGLYQKILDDLQSLDSTDDLLFNGPGEPMLHPRLMDMLREAKRRGFVTTLFTNGLLLNSENVRQLLDLEVDRIYWSMHACTPRSYAAVHPGRPADEFELQVRQGTELMRQRRERGGVYPQVYLVNVLGSETWDEAVVTAELGARMGVDHIRLQLTLSHDDETKIMAASDAQVDRIRDDLPMARKLCQENGISLLSNLDVQLAGRPEDQVERGVDFQDCDWSYRRYVHSGCHVGWLFSRIWVDGTISLCCHPKVVEELTLDHGFRNAYQGERYQTVRNVAARWDESQNLPMFKEQNGERGKGSLLFDKMCDHCGNYEHMDIVQREMGALGALSHLPRTVARKQKSLTVL